MRYLPFSPLFFLYRLRFNTMYIVVLNKLLDLLQTCLDSLLVICGRRKGVEGVKSPLPPLCPLDNLVCRLSLWFDEYLPYSAIVKLYDVYSRTKFGQLLSVCFEDLHVLVVSFHDSNTVGASEGA